MKYFLAIFLFYSSLAWALQPSYELLPKEQITLPDPVLSAYLLDGRSVKVEVQNNQTVIFAIVPGNSVIQILQQNGEVKNIIVKVNKVARENRMTLSNLESEMKGHTFTVRSFYQDRKSNFPMGPFSQYGVNIYGNTAVGNNGYLYLRANKIDLMPTSFYVKYRHKKVYGAYGDDNLLANEIIPSFISTPYLRQFQAGYEDSQNFTLDLWTGQYSPVNFGLNGPPSDGFLFLNRENKNNDFYHYSTKDTDWLSGGRVKYSFGEVNKNSLFATYWNNPVAQKSIPYVGARFNFLSNLLTTRFSIGGSSEKPVGIYNITYRNTDSKNWGLRLFQLNHQIAPKGYESVLSSTDLPREEIGLSLDFYNTNRYHKEGSVFFSPRGGYYLNGNNKLYNYGATLGWQNSIFTGYITARQSENFRSMAPEFQDVFSGRSKIIRPGLELWLNDEKTPVRYRISAYQNFSFNENDKGVSNYAGQETSWELLRRQNYLDIGLRASRLSSDVPSAASSGYSLNPFITYRAEKYQLGLYSNFVYNNSINPDDMDLVSSKVSSFASAEISKNLRLGATYSKVFSKRSFGDLNYDQARVDLTWRFGDPNRPITAVFEGSPIYGVIYEDLNFNNVLDAGEPVRENLSVYLSKEGQVVKSEKTDANGKFSFDRLNYEEYSFSISDQGSENIVYKNIPNSLDLSDRQSYNLNIPYFYAKNYSIKIKSKSTLPDFIPLILKCEKSGEVFFSAKDQESRIVVPTKDNCTLSLDLNSNTLKNLIVDRNDIPLTKDMDLISFNVSIFEPVFSGTVFLDKNENSLIDQGEALKNAKILFKNGLSASTDETGSFFIKKSKISNNTRIEFLKVQGKKISCKSSLNNLTLEELGDRTLSIRCVNN